MNHQNVNSRFGIAQPLMMQMYPTMMSPAEFERSLEQIRLPQQLTQAAMDVRSELFSYAMFKVLNTLGTVMFLKHAYASMGALQDVEPWLHHYTMLYLQDMDRITQITQDRILNELRAYNPHTVGGNGISRTLRRIASHFVK